MRASAVCAPALAATLIWAGPFSHWLVMTVVLTMQPFYSATWQRALERIGGTVLGGLVGALLAQMATTPLMQIALILPLSIVGFAARQVSYGVFVACLTPLIVLLIEVITPGHSSWEVVGMRALFTILGGLIAVVSCLLLWPIWEPDQVRKELRRALASHAGFAEAALADTPPPEREARLSGCARNAGIALNDLEAALSRALQQPRAGHHPEVEAAMVADATLRRISARLTVLRHAGAPTGAEDGAWKTWIPSTLRALAENRSPLPDRPDGARSPQLQRLVAQVDLLTGTLRPGQVRAATAGAAA